MEHTFDYELMACIYDDIFGYSQATEDVFDKTYHESIALNDNQTYSAVPLSTHKMSLFEKIKRFLAHLIERIQIWLEKIFHRPMTSHDSDSFSGILGDRLSLSKRYGQLTTAVENSIKQLSSIVAKSQMMISDVKNDKRKVFFVPLSTMTDQMDNKILPNILGAYDRLRRSVVDSRTRETDEDLSRYMWTNHVIANVNKGIYHELQYMLKRLKESIGESEKAIKRECANRPNQPNQPDLDRYIKNVNDVTTHVGRIVSKIFQPWEG